jgi:hypothetical protein
MVAVAVSSPPARGKTQTLQMRGERVARERARPYRQIESKVPSGTILPNGARVPLLPQDSLAKRANLEMDRWLRSLSPRDRARVRLAR